MNITLREFQTYARIEEPTEEDMIRCFLNKSKGEIVKMKASDFKKRIEEINIALSAEPSFKPRFTLNGIEYGFIPNLDEITYGENRDLVEYINDWQTMHKAMAVAYRPISTKRKEKYIIEEYDGTGERPELMQDMPLEIVQGMNIFFYNLINDLLNCIPKFITTEVKNLASLEENGEAIKKFIPSVKETLRDLIK